MSMGFEITQDDVEIVLDNYNTVTNQTIEDIMAMIDDNAVSKAALSVDINPEDDDEEILLKQTEAAYDEIAWQLYQQGFINQKQIEIYGNTDLLQRVE